MIADDRFERSVSDWLHTDAEHRIPDHLDAVLRLTRSERQRPAWSSLERWLPMDTTFTGRLAPAMRPAWSPLVFLLILALAAAVLVVVGTRQQRLPAPYGPAENGQILYSAHGDIYVADADGSSPRVLIANQGEDFAPLLSKDGTRFLIFRSQGAAFEVMAANVDGSDMRTLTPTPIHEPSWADWSPDGSEVLIGHVRGGIRIASVLATDGSRAIRDLPLGSMSAESPVWRPPDGREIVFQGTKGGSIALYSIGADGAGLRRISPEAKDEMYIAPRISPDGTRVAFWHNLPVDLTPAGERRKSEVHVLEIATGKDTRLGYDPRSRHELWPKFSPDGRSVLLVRFNASPDATSLVLVAADGSDGRGRQIGPYLDWYPSGALSEPVLEFSPDGRKLILSFGSDRRAQIIDVATGAVADSGYADYIYWQRTSSGADVGGGGTGISTPCPGGGCR